MKTLFLFTSSFPYGHKETYLETEIKFLAGKFNTVEIYPFYYNNNDKTIRKVPNNVLVHEPIIPVSKFRRSLYFIYSLLSFKLTIELYKEFWRYRILLSPEKIKRWSLTITDFYITKKSKYFRKLNATKNSIFYFYWGTGWAYVLVFIKKNNTNKYLVRIHGGEAYLERSNGYIPLRKIIFNNADNILTISNQLIHYIAKTYSINQSKLILSRLGTPYFSRNPNPNNNELVRIVSCSNIIPLKRINLIVDALSLIIDRKIEWIHFGDGPLIDELLTNCKSKLKSNIVYNFPGRMSTQEIMNYYSCTPIDAFINLSRYEGIPVSIMEAMSFGIPCIATNAGATSEVVNKKVGLLLPIDFDLRILANNISNTKQLSWHQKRESAFLFWKDNFNDEINYTNLVQILSEEY